MTLSNGDAWLPADDPLVCPVPDEIPLKNPPLKLALAQIQFPAILAINQPNSPAVASFQEAVRGDYPDYQQESGLVVSLSNIGAPNIGQSGVRHIFKGAQGWEISLTQNFVALATTRYQTKSDFSKKVGKISEAVQKHFVPSRADRLGIRFIDRVENEKARDIDKYVHSCFLGPLSMFGKKAELLMTEAMLTPVEKGKMIVRWGYLPPNQQIPGVGIPPHGEYSWILDSDIYIAKYDDFDPERIAADTEVLAGRVYALFRTVFNDDFLRHCGGEL